MGHYYHLYANGDDARNFITSIEDFAAAFNRFGVCAAKYPEVKVLAFSIEESHPHSLLWGEYENCLAFKLYYESNTYRYIISTRGNKDDVIFDLELSEIDSEDYLLNVAAYVIVQPTKDGKQIMPYDYRWGTGSIYFRPEGHPSLWCFDEKWSPLESIPFGKLSYREKRCITHSCCVIPDDWIVSGGVLLPSNYLAVGMYESVFKTFNCFRTFMSAGRKQQQRVVDEMVATRGITLDDLEARNIAYQLSESLFGKKDSRWLKPEQRFVLARELRQRYRLCFRQISTLVRLPEAEIRKYLK